MSDAMHPIGCERLDDFLAHDLVGEDRQRFVEHVQSCVPCRDAVDAQQSLARKLRLAVGHVDSPPRELATRIDRRIRRDRIHRFVWTALAASIAFAALWLAIDRPPSRIAPPPVVVKGRPTDEPIVRIRFPNRDVIAMPVASDSPNVTVVMVYPELRAAAPAPLERNER